MRNKNKCRICGYRFKGDDEVICPECFTAREDDISCGNFSSNDHSHNKTNAYNEKNSFLNEERRVERKSEFMKENYTQPKATVNQNNSFNNSSNASFNYANNQNTNRQFNGQFQRPNYSNNNQQRQGANPYRFNVPQYNNRPNQNNSNAAKIIVVIVIIAIFIGVVSSAIEESQKDNYYETLYSSDDVNAFTDEYKNDENNYYDGSDEDILTDGNETLVDINGLYNISLTNFSLVDIDDSALDDSESDTTYTYLDETDLSRLQVTLEFTPEDSEDAPENVEIYSAVCSGVNIDGDSTSDSYQYIYQDVDFSKKENTYDIDFLVEKNSSIAYIEISTSDGNDYSFSIDLDTGEIFI